MKKKILIVGAGFLQAYVIRKAHEMGYETLAVDADPNAVGFKYADKYAVVNIVDEDACLEYARKENIDGIITAATDYGVLTASYVAQELGLPGLDCEVAKKIKNKYETRRCLFDNHVDDTEQSYLVDSDTDLERLAKEIRYPVMVKPCDGSGSRGASKVVSPEQLASACQLAMRSSLSKKAEIETFINGREYGAESLVVDGEVHVLGIMQKWMTKPPYYAELGHAIPSDLSAEMETRVRRCVSSAIKALGVNFGSVNMDLLITEDNKIHIVDIGARMGGNLIGSHIIPIGTGIDYMGAMIQNAVGDKVDLEPKDRKCIATKLLALTPGKIEKLPDFDAIERENDVKIEHHLAEGDTIREYHTNLDGCGYVIATGEDSNNNVRKAEKVLKHIDNHIVRK